MAATAAYDEIADWYEYEFLHPRAADGDPQHADPLGIDDAIRELLGPPGGTGGGGGADSEEPCLEIGCGTGIHAAVVRESGWQPVGLDISTGMLRHAVGRLPVARADARRLPVRDDSLSAAIAVMVHTDMPEYPAVVREAARVLRPGGVFVHVGVHPCFCGGFADHSDPNAVVIRPGYHNRHWTKDSWTDKGVRSKVGGTHWPLPELMHMFLDADLVLERFAEGNGHAPLMLALRARKAR